jgi:type II secretory pathway component PulF
MPTYHYWALDVDGQTRDGTLSASDPAQAIARLEAQGLRVERLDLMETAAAARDLGPAGARLTRQETAEFARQVAGLVEAGLPLAPGLRALAEELPAERLRQILLMVTERLEAGDTIEEALEAQGPRFPSHLRGLVLAGVRTGDLGHVLGQFVRCENVSVQLRRKLWTSLVYPAMLLVLALILFAFLSFGVVSRFTQIYADFGVSLPRATLVLIQASRRFNQLDWTAFLIGLGLIPLVWLLERAFLSAHQRSKLLVGIPLIGTLWRWAALSEYCHLLALLLDSALPLPEALTMAGEGSRDAELAEVSARMAKDIQAGEPLSVAVARRRQFPRGLVRLLHWAEGQPALSEALRLAGEMFEARARSHNEFIAAVAAIVVVILVLWGLAFMIAALLIPMIQLIKMLSG